MGLDDFTSGSTSKDTGKEENKNTDNNETNKIKNETDSVGPDVSGKFYGNGSSRTEPFSIDREGAVVPDSMAELAKGTDGDILIPDDDVRYHCPMFPITRLDSNKYDVGKRYMLKYTGEMNSTTWSGVVVTCIGKNETYLGELTREQAMLESGKHKEKDIIQSFKDMFGDNVSSSTEVCTYFFGKTLQMRDLAQANSEVKDGRKVDRRKLRQGVIDPSSLKINVERNNLTTESKQ